MRLNTYVRNGSIRRSPPGSPFQMVECYGSMAYDPRIMRYGGVTPAQCGEPHELVFHIAGATYYPTVDGYEVIVAKDKPEPAE